MQRFLSCIDVSYEILTHLTLIVFAVAWYVVWDGIQQPTASAPLPHTLLLRRHCVRRLHSCGRGRLGQHVRVSTHVYYSRVRTGPWNPWKPWIGSVPYQGLEILEFSTMALKYLELRRSAGRRKTWWFTCCLQCTADAAPVDRLLRLLQPQQPITGSDCFMSRAHAHQRRPRKQGDGDCSMRRWVVVISVCGSHWTVRSAGTRWGKANSNRTG